MKTIAFIFINVMFFGIVFYILFVKNLRLYILISPFQELIVNSRLRLHPLFELAFCFFIIKRRFLLTNYILSAFPIDL